MRGGCGGRAGGPSAPGGGSAVAGGGRSRGRWGGVGRGAGGGVRVGRQAVGALAYRDSGDLDSCPRVDRVDLGVVAAGEPERVAVRRDAAHVGAATLGEFPLLREAVLGEVEDRDRALAAVGDV